MKSRIEMKVNLCWWIRT